jgi:AAA+ superfamily predicted ATPase
VNETGHSHGGKHHQHAGPLAAENLLQFEHLEEQFGRPGATGDDGARDIVGKRYLDVLAELTQIVEHQWSSKARRGLVKGFFLSGPPGTGKTTLAKRLALELGRRVRQANEGDSVVMALVDGSEIARSRYGESEERIRDIFAHARSGFTTSGQRTVLLFDDVESILMARGSQHAKEWHFSQDSVFFHAIDDLDTSRSVVVLTSNRPDLVDEAIRDRFLEYRIGYPDAAVLVQVAMDLAAAQQFDGRKRTQLERRLRDAIESSTVRSLRDVQRFVVQQYVQDVLSTPSLAEKSILGP